MPLVLPSNLPAFEILKSEDFEVIDNKSSEYIDKNCLKIVILNLMPNKITTENQILRQLSYSSEYQIIDLLRTATYTGKNTSLEHLSSFYKVFDNISNQKYDGMIITGAPVELLNFEDVIYWEELKEIMQWSLTNVTSTFHICWAVQASLYFQYKVPKYTLPSKMFGVFPHKINIYNKLTNGNDDIFYVPHSRHTETRKEDIKYVDEIQVIAESEEAGLYLLMKKDGSQIFATGHSEYDVLRLKDEYERDISKGMKINIPKNYFTDDNPSKVPYVTWKANGNLLFKNWVDFYVKKPCVSQHKAY